MREVTGASAILMTANMLDFDSLCSRQPVPTVHANDMKRLWELWSRIIERQTESPGGVGWDIRLIGEQCSQGADPVAVWARVALLGSLLGAGVLDNWRDANGPRHIVFDALARYPIPEGIQNFRPEEFLKTFENTD